MVNLFVGVVGVGMVWAIVQAALVCADSKKHKALVKKKSENW